MSKQIRSEFKQAGRKLLDKKMAAAWFAALGLFCAVVQCQGQGTFQVGFDLSPFIAPGSASIVQQYSESGMSFTPIDPDAPFAGFVRRKGGGTPPPGWPDDGTAYLQGGMNDGLQARFGDDSLFGLFAVDLAGYSSVLPDFTIEFVGYRQDGSIVTADFSGSGLNFQTFYFGPEFSGLSRVEVMRTAWSLDNLVVSVPEPGVSALLLLGGALAGRRLISRGLK